MSDQWKKEKVMQIESKLNDLRNQRAAAVEKMQAAEREARQAKSDIEAADNHIQTAEAELDAAKAA